MVTYKNTQQFKLIIWLKNFMSITCRFNWSFIAICVPFFPGFSRKKRRKEAKERGHMVSRGLELKRKGNFPEAESFTCLATRSAYGIYQNRYKTGVLVIMWLRAGSILVQVCNRASLKDEILRACPPFVAVGNLELLLCNSFITITILLTFLCCSLLVALPNWIPKTTHSISIITNPHFLHFTVSIQHTTMKHSLICLWRWGLLITA